MSKVCKIYKQRFLYIHLYKNPTHHAKLIRLFSDCTNLDLDFCSAKYIKAFKYLSRMSETR